MTVEEREYKVYLPLYDGVKNIEIGIAQVVYNSSMTGTLKN